MNPFFEEILQQPQALRDCISYYQANPSHFSALPKSQRPLFTGMGASYHAGWSMSYYAQSLGITALAVEATDVIYYSGTILSDRDVVVFVSQSGNSAEVVPLMDNPPLASVIGVTNHIDSLLAARAQVTLPVMAGVETSVATKTYINTLAVLWQMIRHWQGVAADFDELRWIADQIERRLEDRDAITSHWLDQFSGVQSLVFLGHGPHAATARQAAMMVNEWAKMPASSVSIGAFRHGFIESSSADLGVVIFTATGRTTPSALALADELHGYGVKVLVCQQEGDEFLAPFLNVIPAQLFAEAYARQRGVNLGFRYLSKVVKRL